MTWEPSNRLLTIGDVAVLLGVSPRTINRWRKEGRVPEPVHRDGRTYWQWDEIDRLNTERTNVEASKALVMIDGLLDKVGPKHRETVQEIRDMIELIRNGNDMY